MISTDVKKIERGVRRHCHDHIIVVVLFLGTNVVSSAKGPSLSMVVTVAVIFLDTSFLFLDSHRFCPVTIAHQIAEKTMVSIIDFVIYEANGWEGVYHLLCAKESLGFHNLGKFRCPQHECFVCKQRTQWRCVKCPMAAHDKHAPWPNEILHMKDQPGRALCWRHSTDWRLDTKEVFCQLPLPYVEEEFKIDLTWKDSVAKDDLPPYVHIRHIYLVKKKRDNANDGVGCTNCGPTCCRSCVCRYSL
ncbi:hypothetical protein F2Q68_00006646 [Brassica cretica]|uniref:Uncharacterized protein n=1 Tax=Brassica cretica TaxID=69181 RepID=A0A8S9JJK2_BRACR|nr:hypothetical protein F2Q68_00006646 [Brassica cretica]